MKIRRVKMEEVREIERIEQIEFNKDLKTIDILARTDKGLVVIPLPERFYFENKNKQKILRNEALIYIARLLLKDVRISTDFIELTKEYAIAKALVSTPSFGLELTSVAYRKQNETDESLANRAITKAMAKVLRKILTIPTTV